VTRLGALAVCQFGSDQGHRGHFLEIDDLLILSLKWHRRALLLRHYQAHILAVIPWAFVGVGSETLQTLLTESVG